MNAANTSVVIILDGTARASGMKGNKQSTETSVYCVSGKQNTRGAGGTYIGDRVQQ